MPDLIANLHAELDRLEHVATERAKARGANSAVIRAEANGVLVTVHHLRRILKEHT